jgi:hypothetical protein
MFKRFFFLVFRNEMLHDVSTGLLTGLLSVFLVMYAFQPDRPYPTWVLRPADEPWMLVLVLLIVGILLWWDRLVGVLAVLCVLAVLMDIFVLTRSKEQMLTTSINLVPGLGEKFENQILPREDQVSKKWTVNEKPDPYMLRSNKHVDGNDTNALAKASGVPLNNAGEEQYPLFTA